MRATSPRVALTMWRDGLAVDERAHADDGRVLGLPGRGVGAGAHVDDQALVGHAPCRSGSRQSAGSEGMRGSVAPIESR